MHINKFSNLYSLTEFLQNNFLHKELNGKDFFFKLTTRTVKHDFDSTL